MDDFVCDGDDNFFEAMHHMAMVLEEESVCAGSDRREPILFVPPP